MFETWIQQHEDLAEVLLEPMGEGDDLELFTKVDGKTKTRFWYVNKQPRLKSVTEHGMTVFYVKEDV